MIVLRRMQKERKNVWGTLEGIISYSSEKLPLQRRKKKVAHYNNVKLSLHEV